MHTLLLLILLLIPLNSNAEDHISTKLCDEVADVINDPEFADILTQHTKDHLLKNCYGNTNGKATEADD